MAARPITAPPSEELEMLAEFLGKLDAFHGSRWAIVTIPNTLVFGLGRMFCCFAESQGMSAEPFTDFSAARKWLLEAESETPFIAKHPFTGRSCRF